MRADPRLGTELAGHQILAVIGRGGMAVVYLAEHLRLGRKVALKVLDPEMAEDEAFRERFIRESRIAAGLDHPNVVTVYDAGEADGVLYISMRYVEGTDLERQLRLQNRLDSPRTLSIVSQSAAALDTAHAEGLVHRDVKPANILLTRDRRTPADRVYLSDFGVTKRMHSGAGLTRTGQFVGTVDYVAPEQIQGKDVDGRADVYSLGCVLYRCLTGQVAFPRQTEVGTIYAHLEDAPPVPSAMWPELGPGIDEVVSRALAKSRDDRFATCHELALAADRAIGSPTPAPEPATRVQAAVSPGARLRARHARRRRVTFISGVVVAGAAGLTIAALLLSSLFRSQPENGGPGQGSPSAPPAALRLTWNQFPDIRRVLGGDQNQSISGEAIVNGTIVAVGHDDRGGDRNAAVWTSSNATRWDRVSSAAFGGTGEQRIDGVAVLGEKVVAVGLQAAGGDADPAVWTSGDDGATWQRVDAVTGGLHETGNRARMRFVAAGPSGLMAVGHEATTGSFDAAAWTSADGTNWNPASSASFDGPGHEDMLGVTAFGNEWVAVGYGTVAGERDAAVWVRSGEAWSRIEDESFGGPGDQQINAVIAASSGLVAVGSDASGGDGDAAVWTSTDGRAWDRVVPIETTFGGLGAQSMYTLALFNSVLVAGGSSQTSQGDSNGAIWLSADGAIWTRLGPIAASDLAGLGQQRINALVAFGPRRLIAAGSETRHLDDQGAVWIGSVRS
jgi:tRNA A-37 threonylcarbamoyl transferase component Bud32